VVAGHAHIGTSTVFAVVRFNLDGSLDTTFDVDGKATVVITGLDFGRGVIVQRGGLVPRKIVVGGYSFEGSVGKFSAVRFNSDGSLDNTFDGDGKFISPVGTKSDQARVSPCRLMGNTFWPAQARTAWTMISACSRCDTISYTAIVRGVNDTTGIAVVEVYALN
jgi:uncharacterized delta-60 repeat protein